MWSDAPELLAAAWYKCAGPAVSLPQPSIGICGSSGEPHARQLLGAALRPFTWVDASVSVAFPCEQIAVTENYLKPLEIAPMSRSPLETRKHVRGRTDDRQ